MGRCISIEVISVINQRWGIIVYGHQKEDADEIRPHGARVDADGLRGDLAHDDLPLPHPVEDGHGDGRVHALGVVFLLLEESWI